MEETVGRRSSSRVRGITDDVETEVEVVVPAEPVRVVDEPVMTDVRDPDVDPTLRGDRPDR